jgi:hypothetical protein
MRIALVSVLMISLMGIPAPAVAAPAIAGTGGGAIVAIFNICAMFPNLPWCPR